MTAASWPPATYSLRLFYLPVIHLLQTYSNIVKLCCAAGNYDPPNMEELASQRAQLESFISIMGPALRSVASLDLTLTFDGYMNDRQRLEKESAADVSKANSGSGGGDSGGGQEQAVLPKGPEQLSAMEQLSSLLIAACPNISRLGVGGGVGEKAMRFFGSRCRKVTTLELLDSSIWTGQFGGVQLNGLRKTHILPHVTCLKMPHTPRLRDSRVLARIYRLLLNPSLTHLKLGPSWFETEDDWNLLHNTSIQTLHCHSLPLCSKSLPVQEATFPDHLHFPCLTSIHLDRRDGLSLQLVNALLRASPSLRVLSTTVHNNYTLTNTIAGPERCTTALRGEMQSLAGHMATTGFTLEGVTLVCKERAVDQGLVRSCDTFESLPIVFSSTFGHCRLTA